MITKLFPLQICIVQNELIGKIISERSFHQHLAGTSSIWYCNWKNLENGRNNKSKKIIFKEPSISLNTDRILEKFSSQN